MRNLNGVLVMSSILIAACSVNLDIDETKTAPVSNGGGASTGSCTTGVTALGSVTNSVTLPGQSVYASGSYAYVGTTGVATGIQVVDISNPSSPINVAYISTQSGPGQIDATSNDIFDIYVEGNYLFASTYNGGLLSVDVSNPASPVVLDTLDLASETWGVTKSGNYIYVGSSTAGLYVVDATDPANLSLVNTVASMPLRHIQVVGTMIYGSANSAIQVIDIATPAAPVLLGQLAVGMYTAYETYTYGSYLYTLNKGAKTLLTYDVSNPAAITLVDTSTAGADDFRSIIGNGTKLYVSTGAGAAGQLRVYDISATPAAPTLETTAALSNRGYEISYQQGYVYTANYDGKLQIHQVCN